MCQGDELTSVVQGAASPSRRCRPWLRGPSGLLEESLLLSSLFTP